MKWLLEAVFMVARVLDVMIALVAAALGINVSWDVA